MKTGKQSISGKALVRAGLLGRAKVSGLPRYFSRRRPRSIEQLETRHMLAAAIWNNVIEPMNVNGDDQNFVTALDALIIINELNAPIYSNPQSRALPKQTSQQFTDRYFDVNCDGSATPLDALLVINHLNTVGPGRVTSSNFVTNGGSYRTAACSPQLVEGSSFVTELTRTLVMPDDSSGVAVLFEAPVFDQTTLNTIRDAFEIQVTDQSGNPLALPYAADRTAVVNWTEGLPATQSSGTVLSNAVGVFSADVNLFGVAKDTRVRVSVRLVNNDLDNSSSVVIRGIQVFDTTLAPPSGMPAASTSSTRQPLDWSRIRPLAPSFVPEYGTTTLANTSLANGGTDLVTQLSIRNEGSVTVRGQFLVAIDSMSSPDVQVLQPDGVLPDGRPYFDLSANLNGGILAPGQSIAAREVRFRNLSPSRFTYRLSALGQVNAAPTGFDSAPITSIEAGRTFDYRSHASDTDGDALTYALIVNPAGLQVNSTTGEINWSTKAEDVGNHRVVIRASDPDGLSVEQAFDLIVLATQPNRPPIITSHPATDAEVASSFETVTVAAGSAPVGAVTITAGSRPLLVQANSGDQSLGLATGGTNNQFEETRELRVGEPAPNDLPFRVGTSLDLGLPFTARPVNLQFAAGLFQADVNSDGLLDLISMLSSKTSGQTTRMFAVNLNRGDGSFDAAIQTVIPALNGSPIASATAPVVMDFDGDEKLDILCTVSYEGINTSQFLFWRGMGDGRFSDPLITDSHLQVGQTLASDFNLDGKLDLVVKPTSYDRTGICLGNGDGTFEPFSRISTMAGSSYVTNDIVADVDGVNGPDLVLSSLSNQVEVYLNDGHGNLVNSVALPTLIDGFGSVQLPRVIWVDDFTGDGKRDIVYATQGNGLGIWRGTGDGVHFERGANSAMGFGNIPINYTLYHPAVDLNGDGLVDIYVGHALSEFGVGIGINRGDGTFEVTTLQNGGTDQEGFTNDLHDEGVVAGDYNQDGLIDLAVLATMERDVVARPSVTVFYARSPGMFDAATEVSVGTLFGSRVSLLGDVNNDGALDIVAGDGARFYTALGRGDGSFDAPIFATQNYNAAVDGFLTDLNHDGNLDLVWTGGLDGTNRNAGYGAALGNGNGTFQIVYTQDAGNFYGASVIQAGDFNNDGFTDFASFNPAINAPGTATFIDGFYDVFLNNPTGPTRFTRSFHYVLPVGGSADSNRRSFTTGDFDGDGNLDLATVTPKSDASNMQLKIFIGHRDGSFDDPTSTDILTKNTDLLGPSWLAAGDLNEDGTLDLVLTGYYGRSEIMIGLGHAQFDSPIEYITSGTFNLTRQLYLHDVNGDHHLDLVTMDDAGGRSRILIRYGTGTGSWSPEPQRRLQASPGLTYLAFGDVDGDGHDDMVTANNSLTSTVYLSQGPRLQDLSTADLNGDGQADIVAINAANDRAKIFVQQTDGSLRRVSEQRVGRQPVAVLTADFGGDSASDIVTANRNGRSLTLLTNSGQDTFSRLDIPLGTPATALAAGDLNGDGRLDLVVGTAAVDGVFVVTQTPGGLQAPQPLALGDTPGKIAIADVTGDNLVDLIASLPKTHRLIIMPGKGDGTFAAPLYVTLSSAADGLSIGDFNLDGKQDISVTLPQMDRVALLLGRGQGRFAAPQFINVGDNPVSVVSQDVNHDGRTDLVVANNGDATVSVIYNRFDPTKLYRYQITAMDPDGDPVTYSLVDTTGGVLLDSTTGELVWAPTTDQIGLQQITLEASDGRGGVATQSYRVAVRAALDNHAPQFVSEPVTTWDSSTSFNYLATAADADGDALRYRLLDAPAGATIDAVTGEINWDPRQLALQVTRDTRIVGGTGAYAEIPASPSLKAQSFTFEGWFRIDELNRRHMILNKLLALNPFFSTTSISLYWDQPFIVAKIGNSADVVTIGDRWVPLPGQWNHLAMTYDPAAAAFVLYVNGQELARATTSINIQYDDSPFYLGKATFPFDSVNALSQIRFWNRARSQSEIVSEIGRAVDPSAAGLVADLRFEMGDSHTIRDFSVLRNDGLRVYGDGWGSELVSGLALEERQNFRIQIEDGHGGLSEQLFQLHVAPALYSSVTGRLFDDSNHNQVQDSDENGLAGVVVFADLNRNGFLDDDEPRAASDATGDYRLSGLLEGSYQLNAQQRSDLEVLPARTVVVPRASTLQANLALNLKPPTQIRGTVRIDRNGDGLVDNQDKPSLASLWRVYIDGNGNQVRDESELSVLTDVSGTYTFAGLNSGTYAIRLDNEAGWATQTPIGQQQNVLLDSNAASSGHDFTLVPSADALSHPYFVSTPITAAVASSLYKLDNRALDLGLRNLTYSLAAAPAGMVINSQTGRIAWTPSLTQVGQQRVVLKVTNDRGGFDTQAFTIAVTTPNTSPIITSTASHDAAIGELFSYAITAQDAEQTAFSYRLVKAPIGAAIDSSGVLRWTPLASQGGPTEFEIEVSDGMGGVSHQAFLTQVRDSGANHAPVISPALRSIASVGVRYVARIDASDADLNALSYQLLTGPDGMTIDAQGNVSWRPSINQLGQQAFRVRVSDGIAGGISEQEFTIHVNNQWIDSSPAITSTPPRTAIVGQELRYDVEAIDTDDDSLSYEVLIGPVGLSVDPVRGTLRWLPTLQQLGKAQIKLRAIDPFGGSAEQAFELSVAAIGGPPAILSTPNTTAAAGVTYTYTVTAEDAERDALTYGLIVSPNGMQINGITGEVQWTPIAAQVGSQPVVIQVRDGSGAFTSQAFTIDTKIGLDNQPPTIVNHAPVYATVGQTTTFQILANDPEGSPLHYALRRGPANILVDATSGRVTWTPVSNQVGVQVITLAAIDGIGAAALLSFEIEVLAANVAPVIVSTPPLKVTEGNVYRYDVTARDANHDPLSYRLLNGPALMRMDALGRITWTTTIGDQGAYSADIEVRDPRGGLALQTIHLAVVADVTPPIVSVIPGADIVRANSEDVFFKFNLTPFYPTNLVRVSAVDDVGVTRLTVTANGKPIALDARGMATFSYRDWGFGSVHIVATAEDAAGNKSVSAAAFAFIPFGDDPAVTPLGHPEAVITSPALEENIQGLVRIEGSAKSDNFISYTVSYRRGDSQSYTTIFTGHDQVSQGTLATWDTTLLENDQYYLRLEIEDDVYETTRFELPVEVFGSLKLGNFRLNFEDLTIPIGGMPLTITRSYDTLAANQSSDFGYGWRPEYRNANLRTNLPKTGLESFGIYTPFNLDTKIYLTLPGGERQGFRFTPDLRVLPGFGLNSGLTVAYPRFTSDTGVTSTLSVNGGYLLVNEFGELNAIGGIPWNPANPDFGGYRLTTLDGTVYQIDGSSQVQRITDRNGNSLTFSDTEVRSSAGSVVQFLRDAKNRITAVIDPAGAKIAYAYSANGDLVRVIDRESNVTTYQYRGATHYLESVIDPLGRVGTRLTYDADGRLSTTVDAAGNVTRTSFDPNNQLVRITDALGNVTAIEYDERGNVVGTTNGLGQTARAAYDDNNFLLSETDALGRVIRYTRDSRGLELSTTTPSGVNSHNTYDDRGVLLSTTDGLGQSKISTLDAKGNLVALSGARNTSSKFQYDAIGNLVGAVLPTGVAFSMQMSGGKVSTVTDVYGRVKTYQYDASGLPTSESWTVDVGGNQVTATQTTQYDRDGRVVSRTAVDGGRTTLEYDAAGQLLTTTDALGNVTRYAYDSSGRLTKQTQPDGSTILSAYDAVGNLISTTDALGRETRYVYDRAGRRIQTLFPDETPSTWSDNPVERLEYNAADELIAQIDSLGHRTEYKYDSDGNQIEVRDPLGGVTRTTYDALGRVTSRRNALGAKTEFEYDSAAGTVRVRNSDGTEVLQRLNARGGIAQQVDELGHAVSYTYLNGDLLSEVVDALGHRTRYEYDSGGQLIKSTDALGRATRYEYDVAGRETAKILPSGDRWSTLYDVLGRVTRMVDPNGNQIDFEYDAMSRVVTKRRSDGQVFTFTYTATGQLATTTDLRGITRYSYDARDRLLKRTEPDGQSVETTYDSVGHVTSVTTLAGTTKYQYDARGWQTEVMDPGNQGTRFTYDAAGNITQMVLPNGVVETYQYDQRGHRLAETAKLGDSVHFRLSNTLDATGRLIAQVSDTETSRYTYDAAYHLLSESSSTGRSISYSYDAVGNRVTRIDSAGVTTYEYDVNDRLTRSTQGAITTVYVFDKAGNELSETSGTTRKEFRWDAENRLIEVRTTQASVTQIESTTYDSDGNRTSKVDAQGEIRYLLDLSGRLAQVVAEYSPSGVLVASVIRGEQLIGETRGGSSSYYLADRLGSIRVVLNESGAVTARLSYDGYGRIVEQIGTPLRTFGFAGEPRSLITGLDYLRARSYSSETGRFISADTFVGSLANPLSLHRYQYADLDPLNKRDPTGKSSELAEKLVTIAVKSLLIAGLSSGITVGVKLVTGQRINPREIVEQFITDTAIGFVTGGLGAEGLKLFEEAGTLVVGITLKSINNLRLIHRTRDVTMNDLTGQIIVGLGAFGLGSGLGAAIGEVFPVEKFPFLVGGTLSATTFFSSTVDFVFKQVFGTSTGAIKKLLDTGFVTDQSLNPVIWHHGSPKPLAEPGR